MVLIKVGLMVMLTTGHTATTWVLSMLAYTTITSGYVTTMLSGLRESSRHYSWKADAFAVRSRQRLSRLAEEKILKYFCACFESDSGSITNRI